MISKIPLTLIIFFINISIANAFDHSKYRNDNIDNICKNYVKYLKEENSKNADKISAPVEIFSGKDLLFRMKVRYLDKIRNLSEENIDNIRLTEKAFPWLSPKPSTISSKEILVKSQDGKKYWLPIQDVLINPLKKEIRKNQKIYIYALSIRHKINKSYHCYSSYFINEFQQVTKESLKKDNISKLYAQGQLLIKAGKVKEAEEKFKKILKLDPKHDDALSNLCLLQEKVKKNYSEALICYDDVIEMDKNAYEAFYSKANIFLTQNKPNQSLEEINNAISLMKKLKLPKNALANAYYLRAVSKIKLNDKSSIKDLEKVNKLIPNRVSKEVMENIKKKMLGLNI